MLNSQTSLARAVVPFLWSQLGCCDHVEGGNTRVLRRKNGMTSSRGLESVSVGCPYLHGNMPCLWQSLGKRISFGPKQIFISYLLLTPKALVGPTCLTTADGSSDVCLCRYPQTAKFGFLPVLPIRKRVSFTILPSSVKKCVPKLSKFPFKCSPNIVFESRGLHWIFFRSKMEKALRALKCKTV